MDGFWIVIALAGVVIGATVVYLAFIFFLPEWVGITGSVAREAERSHQEGSVANGGDLGGPPGSGGEPG